MDFQVNLDDIIKVGKAIGEQEKAKAATKKKKAATKRKGSTRKRQEDTPLTRDLIYKVMDETDGTVYFCCGIGKTEELVDQLEAGGHDLYWFTENANGARLRNPQPYQCVLSTRKTWGYKHFWRPGTKYTRCKIVNGETTNLGLFTVGKWPTVPGGICFEIAKHPDGEEEVTEDSLPTAFAGKFERMEREHLSRVSTKDGDRLIIDQVTDERDLLDAIELVLNCTFSEKALKQALYLLQRGTTQFGNFNPENFGEVDRALNDRQQIANLEKAVAKLEQLVTMWKLAYLSQVRYPEEEEINVWDLPGN
ncbi:MAG: hypothetical protein GTO24_08460 [candidate division Zixibacteria bacterium]|nr:hypothetical protein [candidate division Zixibacteria bacterium]